jgi:hypothetical protein
VFVRDLLIRLRGFFVGLLFGRVVSDAAWDMFCGSTAFELADTAGASEEEGAGVEGVCCGAGGCTAEAEVATTGEDSAVIVCGRRESVAMILVRCCDIGQG